MNIRICYMHDEDKVYMRESIAYESPREEGVFPLPANCTYEPPIQTEKPYVPVWDGEKWIAIEDHRKHLDEKGNWVGGTPYWLSEDTYLSEPRYMKELGPLPEGALLTKPEKPQEIIEKEELEKTIQEAKRFLEDTDYVTLKIIEEPETKEQYAEILEQRKKARASIDPMQAQLAALSM